MIGIFRIVSDCDPAASRMHEMCAIGCMQWVVKNLLFQSFPAECAFMKADWD